MGLSIQNQVAFVSKVERKLTKKETWYLIANAAFFSSSKQKDGKYQKDTPFNAKLVCFALEANKVMGALPEKGGFVEISGKIVTEFFENNKGEKTFVNNLTVFTAKPYVKEEDNVGDTQSEPNVDDKPNNTNVAPF